MFQGKSKESLRASFDDDCTLPASNVPSSNLPLPPDSTPPRKQDEKSQSDDFYSLNAIHERIRELKDQAFPLEIRTKKLHNDMTALQGSIQRVLDDFHRVSVDISDLLPPNSKNTTSHRVASKHNEVHNYVGLSLPARIMPRFEQSLMGDLDLIMLHFLDNQVKYRKYQRDKREYEKKSMSKKPGSILDMHEINLRHSCNECEESLTSFLASQPDALDAWFFKYLRFQLTFFSEIGNQVMSLNEPCQSLVDRLNERNVDPGNLAELLGEVREETIVSTPGWENSDKDGDKRKRRTSFGGVFGGGGSGSGGGGGGRGGGGEGGVKMNSSNDNSWLTGVFQRRNVDFFNNANDNSRDDEYETENLSNVSSRRSSRKNSDNSVAGIRSELQKKLSVEVKKIQQGFDDLIGNSSSNHPSLLGQESPGNSPEKAEGKSFVDDSVNTNEIALDKLSNKAKPGKSDVKFPRASEIALDQKAKKISSKKQFSHEGAFPRPQEKINPLKVGTGNEIKDTSSLLDEDDNASNSSCEDGERVLFDSSLM